MASWATAGQGCRLAAQLPGGRARASHGRCRLPADRARPARHHHGRHTRPRVLRVARCGIQPAGAAVHGARVDAVPQYVLLRHRATGRARERRVARRGHGARLLRGTAHTQRTPACNCIATAAESAFLVFPEIVRVVSVLLSAFTVRSEQNIYLCQNLIGILDGPYRLFYVANFLFGLFDDYGESLRDLDAANAKAPHASKMSMPAAPHASRCRCN